MTSMQEFQDHLLPFQIETHAARGRRVCLNATVDQILSQHAYPLPVARLLGELVTMTALLGGMLKYNGVFTVQIKGNGPISMMVADMTSTGDLRGFAQFDPVRLDAKIAQVEQDAGLSATTSADGKRLAHLLDHAIPVLLEGGYLAFTVDQGQHTQRYQGIVSLEGESLGACIGHYFEQSDQLQTAVKIAIGLEEKGQGQKRWLASGLLLQRMPQEGGTETDDPSGGQGIFLQNAGAATTGILTEEDPEEAWNRARILMQSCQDRELLDETLTSEDLLFRLFHEEGVRVWDPVLLRHRCRCSREKLENVLASLPEQELLALRNEDGNVTVDCEFCNSQYHFDSASLKALFASRTQNGEGSVL